MNTLLPALLVVCLALASCASSEQGELQNPFSLPSPQSKKGKDSWIFEPQRYPGDIDVIDPKTYWQTQMIKLPMAVRELGNQTLVELTDEMATYYAGPHYKRQRGTHPYLVRAVFCNHYGDFDLYWRNDELYVNHDSLGGAYGEEKLPLVINLKQPPKTVYTYLSSYL